MIDFWSKEGCWPGEYFEQDDNTREDFEKDSEEDSWLKEMERYDPTLRLLFAKQKAPTSISRRQSRSNGSTTPSDKKPRGDKSTPYRDAKYTLVLEAKGIFMGKSELGVTDASK